jgi:2-haloacid dehalogenase
MNMRFTRREFVDTLKAAGALAPMRLSAASATTTSIKLVAFDAFPIFDARPVFALAERLFPGKGAELSNIWRTRQFEYAWLHTLSRRYRDFWQVTDDALVFAAKALQLELTRESRVVLMDAWLQLKCWPEVPAALRALKASGLRLAFLSNMTSEMLEAGVRNSGLENLFDGVLSTDRVQAYKPDPRAYHMALDAFRLRPQEIAFAAFAGWDAAGARAFGYRTFWVNRLKQPAEELGVAPDAIGTTLDDLVAYLTGRTA